MWIGVDRWDCITLDIHASISRFTLGSSVLLSFLLAYSVPKTSVFVILWLGGFVLRIWIEDCSRKSSTLCVCHSLMSGRNTQTVSFVCEGICWCPNGSQTGGFVCWFVCSCLDGFEKHKLSSAMAFAGVSTRYCLNDWNSMDIRTPPHKT